jgi:hypothetical protein
MHSLTESSHNPLGTLSIHLTSRLGSWGSAHPSCWEAASTLKSNCTLSPCPCRGIFQRKNRGKRASLGPMTIQSHGWEAEHQSQGHQEEQKVSLKTGKVQTDVKVVMAIWTHLGTPAPPWARQVPLGHVHLPSPTFLSFFLFCYRAV